MLGIDAGSGRFFRRRMSGLNCEISIAGVLVCEWKICDAFSAILPCKKNRGFNLQERPQKRCCQLDDTVFFFYVCCI